MFKSLIEIDFQIIVDCSVSPRLVFHNVSIRTVICYYKGPIKPNNPRHRNMIRLIEWPHWIDLITTTWAISTSFCIFNFFSSSFLWHNNGHILPNDERAVHAWLIDLWLQ